MYYTGQPTAKSIRQIRMLKKREPKLVEGNKNALLLRGNKTSNTITSFLKTIRAIKKHNSTYYGRRHETHPFETTEDIYKYCRSTDCSLFLFGSNSKKRPNNLVLGRLYEYQVLDMVELGIEVPEGYEPPFAYQIPDNCRPFLVFQGDLWETSENHTKIRNMLQDFFYANTRIEDLDVQHAMKLVISFSAAYNKIHMRTYEVSVTGSNLLEEDGNIDVAEVCPKADLIIRRTKFADNDMWKEAVKQPKPITRKYDKNVSRDNMGNKRGTVYVDMQNYDVLPLKKRKQLVKKYKTKQKEEEKKYRLEYFAS